MTPPPRSKKPKRANPHPHVAWRDGRPRFQPSPSLRQQGYKPYDLRTSDGRWFTRGQAVDWSAQFCQRLADERAQARAINAINKAVRPSGKRQPIPVHVYSIQTLFDDWFSSQKFQVGEPRSLAPNTIANYRYRENVLRSHDPDLYAAPVEALTRPIIRGLFESLWRERGLSTAKSTILALSSAISWGMLRGRLNMDINPCTNLRMETPPPRVRFGTRSEIATLIATADRLQRPEIGDCIMLAVWTGQRQADRLAFEDKGLLNGRRIFKQAKTGTIVAIRSTPLLEARLEAASLRRRRAGTISPFVILDEKHWKPFDRYHYRKIFGRIRAAAIAGIPADATGSAIKSCPSLADFQDLDLRDTSVTWQALAGATIPEIIAVTGHTLQSATRILRHYLARHPEMADNAMAKMVA